MKKKILAVLIVCVMLTGISGCGGEKSDLFKPRYIHGECEYFYYAYLKKDVVEDYSEIDTGITTYETKTDRIAIGELTELGKEQEVIVIPKVIDGIPVVQLGYYWENLVGSQGTTIRSDNLKKIYIPSSVKKVTGSFECKKIETVIVNSLEKVPGLYLFNFSYTIKSKANIYVPKEAYYSYYFENIEISKTKIFPANVSYHLNYEEAENGGYWWIDNLAGESQLKEPEEPTREGYEFGGWYKESECVTAWNFDEDRTENEEMDEEGNVIFRETELYAKWLSKGAE